MYNSDSCVQPELFARVLMGIGTALFGANKGPGRAPGLGLRVGAAKQSDGDEG